MGRRTRGGGFARKPSDSEIGMEKEVIRGGGVRAGEAVIDFVKNGRKRRRNLTEMRGSDRNFDRRASEVSAGGERGRDAFGR